MTLRLSRNLVQYRPPVGSPHFWYVQGLVILIAGTHSLLEARGALAYLGMLHFVPVSLFFVPVTYAALHFGFVGSALTAAWSTLLTVPNWVCWHSGSERWGEVFQVSVLDLVALLVGHRVERENLARQRAEAASGALRMSEARYRGLFETAGEPVLLVDEAGVVHDANKAAAVLLGDDLRSIRGVHLIGLLGDAVNAWLHSVFEGQAPRTDLSLRRADGRVLHLEAVATRFEDPEGRRFTQLILRDVTAQRLQEAGLRTYAAHVLRAQEEERKRIAQELHDDTIQSIILLYRQLDELEGEARQVSPELARRLMAARQAASELADSLRRLTGGLRPPMLDDLGLTPAIRWLVDDMAQRVTGLRARFEVVGMPRRLGPDMELGLFRIAQEALRNVERHAQASSVWVRLAFKEASVELTVRDDGQGFKVPLPGEAGPVATGRLGLVGMQERARLLGGSVTVQSALGAGTVVHATVPSAPLQA